MSAGVVETTRLGGVESRPELAAAAHHATDVLNELASGNGGLASVFNSRRVRADWTEIGSPGGQPMLQLRLSRGDDAVEYAFRPSELAGEKGWFAMSRAFRSLLQANIHRSASLFIAGTAEGG